MKHLIIFILICFFSCLGGCFCYQAEVKRIKNFPREYTGLDTLIRTDGYYYQADNPSDAYLNFYPTPFKTEVNGPAFIISNNREFYILHVNFKNHIQIQEGFRNKSDKSGRGRGYYTLSGDTIKVKWVMPFEFNCYDIFSDQYVIENDTTIRQISQGLYVKNEIYKFYKYQVDKK